jgi:hypothetical protein
MSVVVSSSLITKRRTKFTFGYFHGWPDNPMLVVERKLDNNDSATDTEWMRIYISNTIEDSISPTFRKLCIKLQRLCSGKKNLPLKWSIYSKVNDERRILYGFTVLSLDDIQRNQDKEMLLKTESGKKAGFIKFADFKVIEKPSFVEYLKSGWYVNLSVGIDFTHSNQNHHNISFASGVRNDYEIAIREVGKILQPYAYKQMVAGFGFGGIPDYQGETEVSHCFTLNGTSDPTCVGLDALEISYKRAVQGTTMWGPTLFTPLLKVVLDYMKQNI